MDLSSLVQFRGLPVAHGLESICWVARPLTWPLPSPVAVFGENDSNRVQVDEALKLSRKLKAAGTGIATLVDVLVSDQGAVILSDGSLLYESLFPWQQENYTEEFSRTLKGPPANVPELSTAFHAREAGETGFFHFMNSIIPRIALREHLSVPGELPVLFNPYRGYAKELQEALSLHIAPTKTWLRVQKLYFPTPFTIEGSHFTRAPFGTQMAQRLLSNLFPPESAGTRKLFLSRQDALVRRMVGEEAFARKLQASFGFEVVTTEGMPLNSQARLFQSASVLVSVHGAGLSNMIFMRPGSLVVEILSPNRLWPTFRCLAARCGHQYACIIGHDIAASEERAVGNEDFMVTDSVIDRALQHLMQMHAPA